MPRYCENPSETMGLVERILTEDEPSGDEARRPYIVAAKLVFLVPQGDGESVADYLSRLEVEITERCGARF